MIYIGLSDLSFAQIKCRLACKATARSLQAGALNPLMVAPQATLIDGAPHYFSHPNYANSSLPTVEGTPTFFGNVLQDRTYASDYPVGVGELAPVFVVVQDSTISLGSAEFPIYPQDRTYSFGAEVLDLSNPIVTGGMRKFVNELPGLGADAANNLGQYIPVAVSDTTTYPGSDYYIIELGEYTEQMHEDLPSTTLRGYRQAGGKYHYLKPAILAQKDRPPQAMNG